MIRTRYGDAVEIVSDIDHRGRCWISFPGDESDLLVNVHDLTADGEDAERLAAARAETERKDW
jgi:hypothetical protein